MAFWPIYYLATTGVDIRAFMGDGDIAMNGVLMEPVMYADMGLWLLPYAAGLSVAATLLASIYPAWFAVRIEPAAHFRLEQVVLGQLSLIWMGAPSVKYCGAAA